MCTAVLIIKICFRQTVKIKNAGQITQLLRIQNDLQIKDLQKLVKRFDKEVAAVKESMQLKTAANKNCCN